MGFGVIKRINILVDNSTAIALAKYATKQSQLHHINCRQRSVLALQDRTICDLVKVGTDDNLSDIFTKILGPNKIESLRDRMVVACSIPTAQELASETKAASKLKVPKVAPSLQVSGGEVQRDLPGWPRR